MKHALIPIGTIDLVSDPRTQSPVLVLYAPEQRRILPIWIDHPEARVIAMALDHVLPPRPLTHHLLHGILHATNVKIAQVAITKIENATFFAEVRLKVGRKSVAMDARPSDAIALGLLANVPIFVSTDVLADAGQDNPIPHHTAANTLSPEELQKISAMLETAQRREEQS